VTTELTIENILLSLACLLCRFRFNNFSELENFSRAEK